jgi:hypothetical protein
VISANAPGNSTSKCDGCKGEKAAPLSVIVNLSAGDVDFVLCEECGRDLANAVGFFCVRDGGWSKLEPRKRKASR